LPGLAWAVLAARTVRECGDAPAGVLLREFFGTWAAWDWRRVVDLGGDAGTAGSAPMPMTIRCPSHPVRSCTDQVGPGWRDLLTQELYEAWEGCDSGVQSVFSAPAMHRRHAAWAVVTVRAPDLDAAVGRVRGRTRALLAALEQAGVADAHAWPRPFETQPDAVRYAIGLGRTPPDAGGLAGMAGPWVAGLPEAEVTWREGGAVATLR
jgi:poly(A) polymerase